MLPLAVMASWPAPLALSVLAAMRLDVGNAPASGSLQKPLPRVPGAATISKSPRPAETKPSLPNAIAPFVRAPRFSRDAGASASRPAVWRAPCVTPAWICPSSTASGLTMVSVPPAWPAT